MKRKHLPPRDTLDALASLDLLRTCPFTDLVQIARDTDLIDLPAGKVVDRAGARAGQFVGVVDGYLRGTTPDGRTVVLGPGDQYGAAELFGAQPHAMTYSTASSARLVVTFGPAFRAVASRLAGVPEAARELAALRIAEFAHDLHLPISA